jgi:purine-binding chemotaxis protein CheW
VTRAQATPALLVRASQRAAALPLSTVVETMRPLPVEALPGMPPFVAGLAVVRAEPVPVVSLDLLIGGAAGAAVGRFVTVRSEAGTFALAVSEVLGVHVLARDTLRALPPLLGAEAASLASAVTTHDRHLIALLETARLVPASAWAALRARGAAS